MTEWSLAALHDVLAEAIPDRDMLICESTRRTYAEVAQRTRSLATFLLSRGVGLRTERAELERWECGQDTVALVLHNCAEYLEAMYGAYRARAVPFNVNQHYRPAEVAALLEQLDSRAVVYHRDLGPLVAEALGARDRGLEPAVLIDVDDGSGVEPLPGSTPYETAAATPAGELPEPSPDDLYIVCTGGTTGLPKAVLWRQADIYLSAMAGNEGTTAEDIADAARKHVGDPSFGVPPMMHAAAQWTVFAGIHQGGGALLHDDRGPFDARRILETAERERANVLALVGDAYAAPIIEELRRRPYDLSRLVRLGIGGAATSEHHKAALLELLPHIWLVDGYGASETGGMAFGARTAQGGGAGFAPGANALVISEDRTRVLQPGEDEIGWTARRAHVPLGYLGDRAKTEATFPIVDGARLAVPGDRARVLPDGAIELLGRDSLVVNTGGEKVFVEEVEAVLRTHPDVADALVVGRPSDRFGQEVVAVVELRPGADLDPAALREHVGAEIARFKAPRAVALCDRVQRHANGKADYAWAKQVALDAVDVS
jgi:fatty-acyl-CoA synthase